MHVCRTFMRFPTKQNTRKVLLSLIGIGIIGFFVILEGFSILHRIQFRRTIEALTSMDPNTVTLFRIYPIASRPIEPSMEFSTPDPIIKEFLQSVTDIGSYKSSPGSVVSFDHVWFVEIVTEEQLIQMTCYIPSEKGNIVLGSLGKFVKGGGGPHYGDFKSQKLFQWYQKYSHLWLNPEGSTQGHAP